MGRSKESQKFTIKFAGREPRQVSFDSVKIAIDSIRRNPSLLLTANRPERIHLWVRGDGLRIKGATDDMHQVRRYLSELGITAAALAQTQEAVTAD